MANAIPTILKGDDTGAITLTLATGRTYTGATLVVAYQGVTKTFTNLTPGGTVSLMYTHDETATFALKCAPLLMRLIGPTGGEETVENAEARIRVTDCLAEVNSGGSFVITPGGGITDPTKVPITDVGDMAARYSLADLKAKVDQIVRVLAQRSLLTVAIAVLGASASFGAVEVQTARLDGLYNDSLVVTNVTGGGVDPVAVKEIINTEVGGTNAVKAAVAAVATIKDDYTTTNAVNNLIDARIPNDGSGKVDNAAMASIAMVASIAAGLSGVEDAAWRSSVDAQVAPSIAAGVQTAKDYADVKFLPMSNPIGAGAIGWSESGMLFSMPEVKFYSWSELKAMNELEAIVTLPDYIDSRLPTDYIAKYGTTNSVHAILSSAASDAGSISTNVVAPVASTVANWEDYWRGDRVRLSVTNYYGNTSGEPPRLRIEEFDHSVTNQGVVSNIYHVVWDELTRQTNYQAQIESRVGSISNGVMEAAWRQTNLQLANKAPRAWQSVTSSGEDAPPNTVWHTAPSTVFAGGTEYAHVAVGEGSICVLVDRGAPVFTEGAEGQFRFTDESGDNYFGFDVRSAYTIGCRTDGISVDPTEQIVSLTYDLTSSSDPIVLHCTNLTENVWTEETVTWEQNPPAGTKVCYINCGNSPMGFYKAQLQYSGGAKFVTNMQADLAGGIAASNEVQNVIQSIVPVITSTGIVWRVKQ